METVRRPLWILHPALSAPADLPGSGAKGLLPVSCSPGPRKSLAVEKVVGTSCEWVGGEPVPSCLMRFLEPTFPSSRGGSCVSGACAPTSWLLCPSRPLSSDCPFWVSLSSSLVKSPACLPQKELHLSGVCTWALAGWLVRGSFIWPHWWRYLAGFWRRST